MAAFIPPSPLYSEDPHTKLVQVALALDKSGLVPAEPSSVDTRKAFADLIKPGLDMMCEAHRIEARVTLLKFIKDHSKRGTWNTTRDHPAFTIFFRNKAAFSDAFNIIEEALAGMRLGRSSTESTPSISDTGETTLQAPISPSSPASPHTIDSDSQPPVPIDELLGLSERMKLYVSESPKEAIRNAEEALKLVLDVSAMRPDSLFDSLGTREAVRCVAAPTEELAPLHPENVRLTAMGGSHRDLDVVCQALVSIYPGDRFDLMIQTFFIHASPSQLQYMIYELWNVSQVMHQFVRTNLAKVLRRSTENMTAILPMVEAFITNITQPNHRGELDFVYEHIRVYCSNLDAFGCSVLVRTPKETIDNLLVARMIKNLLQSDAILPEDLLTIGNSLLACEPQLATFNSGPSVSTFYYEMPIIPYTPHPGIETIYRELAKFGTFQMLRLFTLHPNRAIPSLATPKELIINHLRVRFFLLIGSDVRIIDDSVIVRDEVSILTSIIRQCYCLESLRLNIGQNAYLGCRRDAHETLGEDFYTAFRSNPRLNTLRSLTLIDCEEMSSWIRLSSQSMFSIPESFLSSFASFMKCPQLHQLTHLTLERFSSKALNAVANSGLANLTHLSCDLHAKLGFDFRKRVQAYYNDCTIPLEQLLHSPIGNSLEIFDITLHSNYKPNDLGTTAFDDEHLEKLYSKLSLVEQIIRRSLLNMRRLSIQYYGFTDCLKMIDNMLETSPNHCRFVSFATTRRGLMTLTLRNSFQGHVALTFPKMDPKPNRVIDLLIQESQNFKDGNQLEVYLQEEMRKEGVDSSKYKLFLGKRALSSFNYVELLNEIPKSVMPNKALLIVPYAIKDLDVDREGHYYLHKSGVAAWINRKRKGRKLAAAAPAAPARSPAAPPST